MTIVVAVKDDENIVIGADSQVTEGDMIVSEDSSKILIKELTIVSYQKHTTENFLIAFSGAYFLFELLKTFEIPSMEEKDTFMEYLYKSFVPRLNDYLRKYNFVRDMEGQDGVNWELLIAYKNSLFLVQFNLGILEIGTPYYAIGCATEIALGSLYTTHQDDYVTDKGYMVATAIRACAAHNMYCNDKLQLYVVDKTGKIERMA